MLRRTRLTNPFQYLILLLACTLASGLLAVAGSQSEQSEDAKEEAKPSPVPHPREIPDSEKKRKNPIPANAESIQWGNTLYSTQCAMCHGVRGDGKGDLAASLNMVVPDLTQSKVQGKRTDGEYFYIIQKGRADMPPETRLKAKEVWDMINYIRTMSAKRKAKR